MSLTRIGSIGINTGIKFSGLTTITTLNTSIDTLSIGGPVSIAGTLTYEDVTNIDSVGLVTARNGIVVGSGITLSKDGDVFFTGIATGNGSGLTALNASNISSGTVPTARLGSGTASSSTFLRGDSTFQTVSTDLVDDTTPQLGGNLDVNTKNILFGDSSDGSSDDVLIFGAGSDLAIYHDSVHSRIVDTGTGDLKLQTSKLTVGNASNSETMAVFTENGAVELYYDNTVHLATDANGIHVTTNVHMNDNGVLELGTGSDLQLFHDGTNNYIKGTGDHGLIFATNDSNKAFFRSNGNFVPWTDNAYDLGESSLRWRNIYTTDLQLSNKGSTNDVDGTWGDYTIQEGENDLFLINNRSGKKYKFNLTEVS